MLDVRDYVQPGRGWVYMCVAGSGGGTRYARLPPVIEIIPLIGVSLMLYAKKTKRHPCHSLTTGYRGYTPVGVSHTLRSPCTNFK